LATLAACFDAVAAFFEAIAAAAEALAASFEATAAFSEAARACLAVFLPGCLVVSDATGLGMKTGVAVGVGLAVGVGVEGPAPKKFPTRDMADVPPAHPARKTNDNESRP
jgi:hypothetical protein